MINKKVLIYLVAVALFTVYMFSANYIFNVWLRTDQEAIPVSIEVPKETKNMKHYIDVIRKVKIGWKDALQIKGWVFNENARNEKREVYIVLRGIKETMIFDVKNSSIERPDVTKHFKIKSGIDTHGFDAYIPIYRLKEKNYQIGYIVADETGRYYQQGKIIKIEALLGNEDRDVAVTTETVTKHQFVPNMDEEREMIYALFYKQDPNGDKRRYLVEYDRCDKRYRGIFVHSGSSVSVNLPEDKKFRLNFKCLFIPEADKKADDQVFKIYTKKDCRNVHKDRADDLCIFSNTSQKAERSNMWDTDYEVIVHDQITFSVTPKRSTSWGWTVFSINSCVQLKNEVPR